MSIKVFHSFPEWLPSGVGTWVQNLAAGLDPEQFDTRILLTAAIEAEESVALPKGVRVCRLPFSRAWSRPQQWRALVEQLKSEAPCIYVPNYDFDRACAVGLLPPDIAVCSVLHSDEDVYYENCRRLGGSWDTVVAVSDCIARKVGEGVPSLRAKMRRIHYGVRVPEGARGFDEPGGRPLRLVYCNRLAQYQKRVLDLPLIAAELRRLGVEFEMVIAGKGPDEDELRRQIAASGLEREVRFAGWVDANRVLELCRWADIFLLTSDFEGLPISLLEAMSVGCVPVVYDIASGIGEAVVPDRNGLVVPHGDTEAFARALQHLWRDEKKLAKCAAAAAESIRSRFDLKLMCARYGELFTELGRQAEGGTCVRRDGRVRVPPQMTLRFRLRRRLRRLLKLID